jgi:hypothetical protein
VSLVPEGTGKMIDMLEHNEADVALCVTDAFLVAKGKNRRIKLSGIYCSSPLRWSIATSARNSHFGNLNNLWKSINEKNGKLRVGISRAGSGSQTMAYYLSVISNIASDADNYANLSFHIANNLVGLRDGRF